MNTQEKKTMSVMEMGRMLGLKKTDSYWLVHKGCFETTLVQGVMRINIASFEHWYANQIKHRKVDGPPPGEELRAYSYSIQEMAEVLGVTKDIVYAIVKRDKLETFEIDTWMRVRKDVFQKWYESQTKYRTAEDREHDAEQENASMTMPQVARLLGIKRAEVYELLKKKENKGIFDVIILADRKRITKESFERWYQSQDQYQKVTKKTSGLQKELGKVDDSVREALLASAQSSFTVKETALLIGTSPREVYRMIEDELLDSFTIGKMVRIRRSALEWWLSPQDDAFRREVK